jgi:membrane associated rhomboid family serine protease
MHLLLNMVGLFLFAPIVESYLGARRYLIFYLLCGCSGAFVYLLLYYLGVLGGPVAAVAPLVGASAGIYGVLVAAAVIAPDLTVVLLFPPIPIQLKYLALIMVGIAGYVAFTQGNVYKSNAGGQAAHLGGAALGFLLIRFPQVLNPFGARKTARRARRRSNSKDWSKDMNR